MGKRKIKPFGRNLKRSLKRYFADLKGDDPTDLHQQLTEELERHLYAFVLAHTNGNISRTASILGISRVTLRKKLTQYGMAQQ